MTVSDFFTIVPLVARLLAIPLLVTAIVLVRLRERGSLLKVSEVLVNGIVIIVPLGVLNHQLFLVSGTADSVYAVFVTCAWVATLFVIAN